MPSSHGDGGRWGLLCGVSSAVWGGVWLQEVWAVPCEGHIARSRMFRRTAGPLVGPVVASDPTHRREASRRELSRSPEFLFAGCRRPRWGLARAWIWWGPLSMSLSTQNTPRWRTYICETVLADGSEVNNLGCPPGCTAPFE